jgi:hypothetical protein
MANLWCVPFRGLLLPIPQFAQLPRRALTRNPEIYDEPHSFRPERFIDGKPLDPRQMVFGFGRR